MRVRRIFALTIALAIVSAGSGAWVAWTDAKRALSNIERLACHERAQRTVDRSHLLHIWNAIRRRLEHDAADIDSCHRRIKFEDLHLTVLYHRMGHGRRPTGAEYGEWPERPAPAPHLPEVVP